MPRPRQPTDRASDQRDALLALSRSLARGREGGILSDGLDLILDAAGTTRGCAYSVSGGRMELVAHRGLPAPARRHLDRLAVEPPWFIAQTAAVKRAQVLERDVPSKRSPQGGSASDDLSAALSTAGWIVGVGFPLVVGREAIAVLVVAAPTVEPFDAGVMAFLETASNMLTLGLARETKVDVETRDRGGEIKTAQMAALGMLAVGFADDLRGPLDAVALLLSDQRSLLRAPPVPTFATAMSELVDETTTMLARAQEVVTRLLAAVRESEPEPLDVADLARSAVGLVASPFRSRGVKLEATIDDGLGVIGRREELIQLLMSLLLNAADACESAKDRGKAPLVRLRVGLDGTRVVVSVGDSGVGVPPNLRARIFDPFFTTKTGALGLGLTLAKHAVVAHRGHIEIAASELGGAMFRILLPAAASSIAHANAGVRVDSDTPPLPFTALKRFPEKPPSPRAPRPDAKTRRRILWIDDDDLFLRSIRRAFPDFDVVTAQTAEQARAELDRSELAPPVRIFCDIGMPAESGADLHAAVTRSRPDLARLFVFVTGGVITPEIADYVIGSGCPTLLKPVGREEILSILEQRLSTSDTPPPSAPTLRDTTPPAKGKAKTLPPLPTKMSLPVDEKETMPPLDERKTPIMPEPKKRAESSRAREMLGASKPTVKLPAVKKPDD